MEITSKNIKKIWLSDEAIFIETKNGNVCKEAFADYPRLKHASPKQRACYSVSHYGIHWEDLDEDLSFEGFFSPKTKQTGISKIFNTLYEINVSAFARRLGISQPLMAAYINGSKNPGPKRKKEIEKELHQLGKELQQLHFSKFKED